MLKFSLITCTYNSALWLEANILSVERQTYRNFEHIFIDGYSTDGTLDIIKKYQTKFPDQIKLYFDQRGIAPAMNEGVKKANGDYLLHLHADDSFYDENVLSDTARYLSKEPLDWIYGKINVVDDTGNIGTFPNRKIWQKTRQNPVSCYLLKFYNYIPHQAVFIRRSVFEKFGYFDETLTSAMDADLWLRIKNRTKWKFFNRLISNYRLHGRAQSSRRDKRAENKKNYQIVQKRYLNRAERLLSKISNRWLEFKNKNYR